MNTPSLRLCRLQKIMRQRRLSAFLVTNLTNIEYLTGVRASAGVLLVEGQQATLFVDSRYTEMASLRARGMFKVSDPAMISEAVKGLRTIGFDPDHVTVARLDRLRTLLKNKKLVQEKGLVEGLRRTKDDDEIRAIRRACSLTKKVLAAVPHLFRFGMTEKQLALKIFTLSMDLGADEMAFDTIVAFGENTSRPHHSPEHRPLKKGDIIQIDMGVKVNGYCSDYSRIFFTTDPTPEQKKAYRALQLAKKAAEKLLKPGVSSRHLDIEARRVLKEHGYGKEFSHSLGHGVGMDIHEGVILSERAPLMRLLKNEVVTIEPGLYFPGKFGMRIEDTIVVGNR